jgi:hypothetical protein
MVCPINPDLLEEGRTYEASIIVRGNQDLEIQLELEIQSEAARGAAPAKGARKRGSGKKPPASDRAKA